MTTYLNGYTLLEKLWIQLVGYNSNITSYVNGTDTTGPYSNAQIMDGPLPEADEQSVIHDIIFDELSKGIISSESKTKYINIINNLARHGAEGVILGCTEIPLLIKPDDVEIKVLDSSLIHAETALNFALEE